MQVSLQATTGKENNDVRPGHMPQPHLREDVDEHGNPVLHKADQEEGNTAENTAKRAPDTDSSSSGSEEKDITD